MSKSKVFISFRMSDGSDYKDRLSKKFEELDYVINKSEDVDGEFVRRHDSKIFVRETC